MCVAKAGFQNIAPGIERLVGPIVSALQFLCCKPDGLVDDLAGIVPVPVPVEDSALRFHVRKEPGSRIGCQDVKGTGSQGIPDGPVDRAPEYFGIVGIEAEHKATIDHNAEGMEPLDRLLVVSPDVLKLIALLEVVPAEGLEADKDAPHPASAARSIRSPRRIASIVEAP